jgi:hypothetical protein
VQVEEAQRAVLFKELGSSTGEAKVRIDAELKSMQERHGEADEMRTLYIEEAQVAWKKLKVSGPGTERFLAEFGHSVYPPTMLELQKYSGILKKAVEMATLKADLELFKAELKEAAAMPQNNKVLKDEKKKRCAPTSSQRSLRSFLPCCRRGPVLGFHHEAGPRCREARGILGIPAVSVSPYELTHEHA